MTEFLDDDAVRQIKTGFDALRAALGLGRNVQDLVKDGPEKEAALQKLAKAEIAIELAEVQIAQALGYKLCQCAFPPKVMLSIGRDHLQGIEIFRCSSCGKKDPSEQHLAELNRQADRRHPRE